MSEQPRKRITIAVLALGGQGGGVLADWLVHLGTHNGYYVQSTSVPGVAQRTGSTVYYLELFPEAELGGRTEPVLALTPVPGDVDLVVASELMEGGRAILRGFVSRDRTTLITSTHRIYAISEKSAMGNGLSDGSRILDKAELRAKRLIAFDMEEATVRSGSVISSVMFGAVAGSGVLPFSREQFEAAIRASGIAVDSNLAGFAAGLDQADAARPASASEARDLPMPTTAAGAKLRDRVIAELPEPAHAFALEGVRRLMDYQDAVYAALYVDRLSQILAVDRADQDWALTREAARYLALWMSYEDTIRVADLKVRRSRLARIRSEVHAKSEQLMHVTEYMHPRFQEVCETLPAPIGRRLLSSAAARRALAPLFREGRHVTTTKLGWFLMLWALAGFRRWRRGTLRYQIEQERIGQWLHLVRATATTDWHAALQLVECQRLIKGYGDTHERGLRNFTAIVEVYRRVKDAPNAAEILKQLREAALADEEGQQFAATMRSLALAA